MMLYVIRLRDLAVYRVATENMYQDYIVAVTCVSSRQMHAMANEIVALVSDRQQHYYCHVFICYVLKIGKRIWHLQCKRATLRFI